jgi:RNA polymerase sigma-70 factor (ECF subfamily)
VRAVRGREEPGESDDLLATPLLERAIAEAYRYAIRLTGGDRVAAEDLVQDACVAFAAHARAHDDPPLSVGWMIVVVRRRFVDQLRRTSREQARLARAGVADDVLEGDWSRVEGGEALTALARLAADQRAALVFRYIDDLPVSDVAALLDRSAVATESLLARARRELARYIEEARRG